MYDNPKMSQLGLTFVNPRWILSEKKATKTFTNQGYFIRHGRNISYRRADRRADRRVDRYARIENLCIYRRADSTVSTIYHVCIVV